MISNFFLSCPPRFSPYPIQERISGTNWSSFPRNSSQFCLFLNQTNLCDFSQTSNGGGERRSSASASAPSPSSSPWFDWLWPSSSGTSSSDWVSWRRRNRELLAPPLWHFHRVIAGRREDELPAEGEGGGGNGNWAANGSSFFFSFAH